MIIMEEYEYYPLPSLVVSALNHHMPGRRGKECEHSLIEFIAFECDP